MVMATNHLGASGFACASQDVCYHRSHTSIGIDWSAVQERWLFGRNVSLSEMEVLDRFRLMGELLGVEWLSELKMKPGFAPPIPHAMLMADKFLTLKNCVGVDKLL